MRDLALVLVLLAACAGPAVPPPSGPEAAVLVVRTNVVGYLGRGVTRTPHKVYWARLAAEGETAGSVPELIESDHYRGPLAFAFNVKPGRYAMVCAVTVWEGKDRYVFLPEALIEATITTVAAGERAYMGSVDVRETRNWSRADASQKRFLRAVQAGPVRPNTLQMLFPRAVEYKGEDGRFSRDAADVARTRKTLEAVLPRLGW